MKNLSKKQQMYDEQNKIYNEIMFNLGNVTKFKMMTDERNDKMYTQ